MVVVSNSLPLQLQFQLSNAPSYAAPFEKENFIGGMALLYGFLLKAWPHVASDLSRSQHC